MVNLEGTIRALPRKTSTETAVNQTPFPTRRRRQDGHPQKVDQMVKNDFLDENKVHDLLFDVRRSVRYHNRRRQFFDRFSKLSDTFALLSGSATIITVVSTLSTTKAPIYFAAATAIASAINLVFGTKSNARLHHDLARQFISLEKRLISPDLTPAILATIESDRLSIEAEEPPVLRVLDLICHNELIKAMGYGKEELFNIPFWKSACANLYDVFPSSIRKNTTER